MMISSTRNSLNRRQEFRTDNVSVPNWLVDAHLGAYVPAASATGLSGTLYPAQVWRNSSAPLPRAAHSVSSDMMSRSVDDIVSVMEFVTQLFRLSQNGKPRKASDLALNFFDTHFEQGEFTECDLALDLIGSSNLTALRGTVIVALLAATLPAKQHLSTRKAFIASIAQHLAAIAGAADADLILRMYR